jgi:tubulin-folding cofactor B
MQTNFNDVSAVEKYVMPPTEYETRTDSVLAWKKTQKLGRFDPNAPSLEEQKIRAIEREIDERGLSLCNLLPSWSSQRKSLCSFAPFYFLHSSLPL